MHTHQISNLCGFIKTGIRQVGKTVLELALKIMSEKRGKSLSYSHVWSTDIDFGSGIGKKLDA